MSIGSTFKTVTPSDSADLPTIYQNPPAGLRFGSTGSVVLVNIDRETVTLTGIQEGELFPARVKKVMATGTTVTNIVAIYL